MVYSVGAWELEQQSARLHAGPAAAFLTNIVGVGGGVHTRAHLKSEYSVHCTVLLL